MTTRHYRSYTYRDAKIRVCTSAPDAVEREFLRVREVLEAYIRRQPEFRTSLRPLEILPDAPEIVRRMHEASQRTGVGPMAAVAGIVAEFTARAAVRAGADEAIVENGGDMFLISPRPVTAGIFAGASPLAGRLAFRIPPQMMPLALCSSSSSMGHSFSLGRCDLATVVSEDAALADAAATLACNLVKEKEDLDRALEKIRSIPGVQGVLLVKDDAVGMAGNLPPLVKADSDDTGKKITCF